jgi:DNA-binding response OmpR family regulator
MNWLQGLANTRGARYIMISGQDSPELKDQVRDAGAVGFFPKPIDHRELLALLEKEREATGQTPRRWWAAFFDFL